MTQWPHLSLFYVWKEQKSEYIPLKTWVMSPQPAASQEVQCEPQASDENGTLPISNQRQQAHSYKHSKF